jgi:hypothetical protein
MGTKRKTCNIRTLFVYISPTNNDTLVLSLYQRVETHSKKAFRLLSQPLPHLCLNLFVVSENVAIKVEEL